MNCITCKAEHDELFCPNCGEKSQVPKITFGSIFSAAIMTVTNMDKGFLFNVKNLILAPQKVVNTYLLGKRKSIFNPISFLIICVTTYLIVEAQVQFSLDNLSDLPKLKDGNHTDFYNTGYNGSAMIMKNFKYFWILSIIWLSMSTKVIFRRYNFAEHLAINSFVIGQSSLLGIIGLLIIKMPLILNPLVYLIIIWILFKVFQDDDKNFIVFLQAIGATLLFFVSLFVVVAIIGGAIVLIGMLE